MGPSGAGKTTLIKILTGQLKPDKGSAEIMKHDTVSLSGRDKKEIGIMMDQFGVYEMSCTDNLRIYAAVGTGNKRPSRIFGQNDGVYYAA